MTDYSDLKNKFKTDDVPSGSDFGEIIQLAGDAKDTADSAVPDNGDGSVTINNKKIIPVDNNGLTTVPAFVNLQAQVDNSAVGINLLKNTGDLSDNWDSNGTVDTSQKPAILHYHTTTLTSSSFIITQQQLNDGLLQPSTTYTASFYAKGTGTFRFYCFPDVSTGESKDTITFIKLTSDYKLYTITFTTNPNLSGSKYFLLRQDYTPSDTDENTVEAYIYGLKLEKGSVVTDWSANPAEILVESDYSKIEASINHILKYHSISITVSPNFQVTDNHISHFQKLGAEATLVSMVNIKDKTDSNPQLDDDARIKNAISRLQTAGIKIDMIKPHLGINWSDGFSRGTYIPALYPDFFNNWEKILLHYAEICEQNDIPILCIGCEQVDNFDVSHAATWENIIADIRANYPKLLLTVAFNRLDLVPSYEWPAKLDYVGTNVYPALSPYFDENNLLKLDDLKANFYYDMHGNPWGARISAINDTYHLPIFITETGCMPQKDGLLQLVSQYNGQAPYDYHVSALFMETAFAGWMKDIPSIIGFAWWHAVGPLNFYDGTTESEAEMVYKKYVGGGLI